MDVPAPITDHGVMYGVVDFYEACKKAGIHPVIGCEVYVAQGSRFDKSTGRPRIQRTWCSCAKTSTGYQNLIKLCSPGLHRRAITTSRASTMELLRRAHRGADRAVRLPVGRPSAALILQGRMARGARPMPCADAATSSARTISYIELQDHGLREQKRSCCPGIMRICRGRPASPWWPPTTATTSPQEDADAQEVLMCIQTGKTLEDDEPHAHGNRPALRQERGGDARPVPRMPGGRGQHRAESPERCQRGV